MIGKAAGVSDKTVGAIRAKLRCENSAPAEDPPGAERRTGRDGKRYPATKQQAATPIESDPAPAATEAPSSVPGMNGSAFAGGAAMREARALASKDRKMIEGQLRWWHDVESYLNEGKIAAAVDTLDDAEIARWLQELRVMSGIGQRIHQAIANRAPHLAEAWIPKFLGNDERQISTVPAQSENA
jgi:hypothetical protein